MHEDLEEKCEVVHICICENQNWEIFYYTIIEVTKVASIYTKEYQIKIISIYVWEGLDYDIQELQIKFRSLIFFFFLVPLRRKGKKHGHFNKLANTNKHKLKFLCLLLCCPPVAHRVTVTVVHLYTINPELKPTLNFPYNYTSKKKVKYKKGTFCHSSE